MCFGGGDTQTKEAGPMEKKLVELAERRLNEYETHYKPFENRRMAEAKAANSPQKKALHTADAVAASRLGTAQPQVAPPVGAGKLALVAGQAQGNRAAGITGAVAPQIAEDNYANRMMNFAAIGRGQAGQSVQMHSSVAARELGNSIAQQNADSYVDQARMGMYGTVAGAGVGVAANKFGWFDKKKGA